MATARGMWESAKHPRGYHGHFGATGHRRSVTSPRPRKRPTSDVAKAPRVVYETVTREHGRVTKTDKARARTKYVAGRSARQYDYR